MIEEILNKHYDKIFEELCDLDDEFYELCLEYKGASNGLTIRRSWADREKILEERLIRSEESHARIAQTTNQNK